MSHLIGIYSARADVHYIDEHVAPFQAILTHLVQARVVHASECLPAYDPIFRLDPGIRYSNLLGASLLRVSPRGPGFPTVLQHSVSHSLCCLLEKMSGLPASASNVACDQQCGNGARARIRWRSGIGGFPLSG